MKRILVVEDDNHINQLLFDLLSEAYEVSQAYAGSEGKHLLIESSFDLVLLDLMLPGISGEQLIGEIREVSTVPIIILTAKAEVNVLKEVLELGANDYIAKPFNTIEVLARVEAQLRDHPQNNPVTKINVGMISLDEEKREVKVQNKRVELTQKEFELIKCFLKYPDKVFTKANLYESVWGDPYFGDDNTISVHISRLRNKLNQYTEKELIETVWGVGFKLSNKS